MYIKSGTQTKTQIAAGEIQISRLTLASPVADATAIIYDQSAGADTVALTVAVAAKGTETWHSNTGGNQWGARKFIGPVKIAITGDASTFTEVFF